MKGIPLKMYLCGRVCSHYLPANVAACDITVTHILRFFYGCKNDNAPEKKVICFSFC